MLFAAVIIVAFPNVVFFGKSLVASDALNPFEPLRFPPSNLPDALPANEFTERGLLPYPNFHDIEAAWWQAEPALGFFANAVRNHELPLWDPYAGAGSPAMESISCSFFFPPQILLCLAGPTSLAKNIYILVLFWSAGFGTFILLRQHGVRFVASFAGGLAFMFSGAVQAFAPCTFKGQLVAILPWPIVATCWLFERPTWKRCAVTAVVYACVALAAFPPIVLAAFSFVVIYAATALAVSQENRKQRFSRFFLAALMSMGLAAIAYVPAMLAAVHSPQVGAAYDIAARKILQPRRILQLFFPTATGGSFIYANPVMADPPPYLMYVGVTAVYLAILSLRKSRRPARTLMIASAVTAVLFSLKLWGVQPFQWLMESTPLVRTMHYQYFGVCLGLIVAVLAGIGVERLAAREGNGADLCAGAIVIGIAFLILWHIAKVDGALSKPDAWRWVADFRLALIFLAIAAVLATIAIASRYAASTAWAIAALIAIEGITNATYPRQPRFDAFANPPKYVEALKRLEGRVFTGLVLTANLGSTVDVPLLESQYPFNSPRLFNLYSTYAVPDPPSPFLIREGSKLPPDPVLARAGVENAVILKNTGLAASFENAARERGYTIGYEDESVRVYRKAGARRAFFSSTYSVTNAETARTRIATAGLEDVILEKDPGIASVPNLPNDPDAEIVHAGLNRVSVRVRAPRAGLLYLADTWFPGWSAKVNGKPEEILIANYAFRAVVVPQGDSTVDFAYWPEGFTAGIAISLLSAGALLVCLLVNVDAPAKA